MPVAEIALSAMHNLQIKRPSAPGRLRQPTSLLQPASTPYAAKCQRLAARRYQWCTRGPTSLGGTSSSLASGCFGCTSDENTSAVRSSMRRCNELQR
jgi:hypothetical protein